MLVQRTHNTHRANKLAIVRITADIEIGFLVLRMIIMAWMGCCYFYCAHEIVCFSFMGQIWLNIYYWKSKENNFYNVWRLLSSESDIVLQCSEKLWPYRYVKHLTKHMRLQHFFRNRTIGSLFNLSKFFLVATISGYSFHSHWSHADRISCEKMGKNSVLIWQEAIEL